jgi:hypothetical protein
MGINWRLPTIFLGLLADAIPMGFSALLPLAFCFFKGFS